MTWILNSPGELVRFCEFENYSFGIQFCNINSFFLSAAQKELGNQRNRLPFSCWLLIYMNFFSLQVDINSPGHNDNLSLPKVFYEYPLTICTQFLQFSRLKCPVWWTWFLTYFKLVFYRLQQAGKSCSNLEKNPVHQTKHFKLENSKNQVQIDMRIILPDRCLHHNLSSLIKLPFNWGTKTNWPVKFFFVGKMYEQ